MEILCKSSLIHKWYRKNGNYEATDATWYVYSSRAEKVIMNSGLTGIGNNAFLNFINIKECIIPNTVTSIGRNAFQGCKNISTMIIPDSVESIGAGTFNDCTELNEIYVPLSVRNIGEKAFEHNGSEICYVNYEGTKQQWNTMVGNVIPGGDNTRYLYEIKMP